MKDLQECFERKHADLLVSFTQALKKIAQQGTKELEKVLALLMDKLDGVDESSIEKITRNMQQAAKTAGRKLSASQTNVRALYGQKRERFTQTDMKVLLATVDTLALSDQEKQTSKDALNRVMEEHKALIRERSERQNLRENKPSRNIIPFTIVPGSRRRRGHLEKLCRQ